MNKKTKLMAIGVAILIVAVAGAFLVQMVQKQRSTIRVACVGDSITEGSDYPSELWMLLGSNYTVGTFGQGGTTVSFDAPTPYVQQAAFQDAKAFQPDIVVIMLGTNDALPAFQIYNAFFVKDYLRIISEFHALQSKPQIWIVLPPPIFHDGTGLSTEFFKQKIIPKIQEAANQTSLPTINVYAALANHPECFPDGVHPNTEGSKLIAQEVYKALTSD